MQNVNVFPNNSAGAISHTNNSQLVAVRRPQERGEHAYLPGVTESWTQKQHPVYNDSILSKLCSTTTNLMNVYAPST